MSILRHLRGLLKSEKLDAEMVEEMRAHLELQAKRHRAAGLSIDEARYAALREFGNVARFQQAAREGRPGAGLELWLRDLQFAARSLRRSPAFAGVTVGILALGIGAAATIFAIAHALLWSPLKYQQPEQLVTIQSAHPRSTATDLAPGTFGDLADCRSFSALAAHYYYYVNLTSTAEPLLLNSAEVTRDYFRLFGVAPWRGRLWDPSDPNFDAAPVVVLSHQLWRSVFNARDSIIGEPIILDEMPHTVIAVMPPDFKEPAETVRFWRPMRRGADNLTQRDWRYWTVFGRLAPATSLDTANAEMTAIAGRLARDDARNYADWTLRVVDLRDAVVRDHRRGLLALLGGVACLTLITVANVAGLALVRASARRPEMAVRQALGASRWQLFRLLMLEAGIIALAGAAGGLAVAHGGLIAFAHIVPAEWLPRMDEIGLTAPVVVVTAALAFATGLVLSLAPLRSTIETVLGSTLKSAGRSLAGSSPRLRAGLVIGEIAFTLMLVTGACLLGRNLLALSQRDSGVEGERVLAATASLNGRRYDTPDKGWEYFQRAERALAALPGVECVGLTQTVPFRWGIPVAYRPGGAAAAPVDGPEHPSAFTDAVNVDYFRSVGIKLRAGRLFTVDDDARRAAVIVLSEAAARRYFGSVEGAVGRILVAGPDWKFEVVGVVSDVRRAGLGADVPLQVYRAMAQRTPSFATFMVRSGRSPQSLASEVRAALKKIDPAIPVTEVLPLAAIVDRTIAAPRLNLMIFANFAGLALVLATIGLYGLVAYAVLQRQREFAIRSALGADDRNIRRLVLGEAVRLSAWGVALGIAGAYLGSHLMRKLAFATTPHDPVAMVAGPIVLSAVTIIACWLPARRAAHVDPAVALRAE